jgi:hypothetical protein
MKTFTQMIDRVLTALMVVLILTGLTFALVPGLTIPDGFSERVPRKSNVANVLDSVDTQTVQAVQRFEVRLDRLATSTEYEQRFQSGLQQLSHELTRSGNLLRLVKLMAKDRFQGGDRATQHINQQVQQHLGPVTEAYAQEIYDALNRFETELAGIRGTATDQIRKPLEDQGVLAADWDQALKQLGVSAAITGVMLPVDVVLVARTRLLPRLGASIWATGNRLLGASVTRTGLAGIAPFVDGPLPVGDLIAGAGLAWTAVEIHSAGKRFRHEVLRNVHRELSLTRAGLHQKAKETSMACLLRHQNYNQRIAALAQQLQKRTPQPRTRP